MQRKLAGIAPFDPSKSKRIDDLEIGGVLSFELGPCGDAELDLDAEGYHFFLPNSSTTALILIYQESDDTIYMFINVLSTEYPATVPEVAAMSTESAATSSLYSKLLPIGHVRAPKGISSAL